VERGIEREKDERREVVLREDEEIEVGE